MATTIPLAVGSAFAELQKKSNAITVVFFGDGALDEGAFWESLNIASVKHPAVLFVCEDNDLAIHTGKKDRHGFQSIVEIVKKYNCGVVESNTIDVEEIKKITKDIRKKMQEEKQPYFLKLDYF